MALDVFSDFSEKLNYNRPNFPLYVRSGTLRLYDKFTVACHWHPDLEFILVLDGSMEYFVNGKIQHLEANEGIFVNSKRLHYNYSENQTDSTFIVVVIHPILLGDQTLAGKEYFDAKFGASVCDFIHLTDHTQWQSEILRDVRHMYDEMNHSDVDFLSLLAQAVSLCAMIGRQIESSHTTPEAKQAWPIIWNMTSFIHKKYDEKITLDDIAFAGSVCRSKCCELFMKHIGQTPNAYVTRYRIHISGQMLRESNRSITEIALACGFQNASYFAQVFRKETGFSPKQYRASNGQA